jgi:hypothetical protein
MSTPADARHFVQIAEALRETNPWTNNEWLCQPDLVAAEKLLLVRANMAPGHCHPFHYHRIARRSSMCSTGVPSSGSVRSTAS